MADAISTPGMGALGIVRALQGRKPAQKKKKKSTGGKNVKRRRKRTR
jgi:hypothetical protein